MVRTNRTETSHLLLTLNFQDQNTEQFDDIKGMIRELSKTANTGFEMMKKAFSLVSKLVFFLQSH